MSPTLPRPRDASESPPRKGEGGTRRLLIEELDMTVDADADQLWIHAAQRRYDAYQQGELEARPGDEVMASARNSLK